MWSSPTGEARLLIPHLVHSNATEIFANAEPAAKAESLKITITQCINNDVLQGRRTAPNVLKPDAARRKRALLNSAQPTPNENQWRIRDHPHFGRTWPKGDGVTVTL